MDPAWAAPAACSADTLAVPRTPASSPPSVGRVQIAAPPPAGSSPPRTPLVAPARIVPPASSLRPPLPLHGKWAIAAGFLLRRNRSIRLLREGFSLRRSHPERNPGKSIRNAVESTSPWTQMRRFRPNAGILPILPENREHSRLLAGARWIRTLGRLRKPSGSHLKASGSSKKVEVPSSPICMVAVENARSPTYACGTVEAVAERRVPARRPRQSHGEKGQLRGD